MNEEIWKDIKGFEGIYQVSSFGNVRSYHKRGGQHRYYISKSPILLSGVLWSNGYYFVTLRNNGIIRPQSIHRLVADAFLPNPNNYSDVNHKNGIKTDNRVENLEWCTRSYNIKHSFDNGLHIISQKQRENSMRPVEVVYPNGIVKRVKSVKEAAKLIGYSHYNSLYKAIKNGKIKNGFSVQFITKKQYDNTSL